MRIPAIRRYKKATLALIALSCDLNIAKKDEVIDYLKLPLDLQIFEIPKDAPKLDFEVQGLIEVYRQTFPQRTES